MKKNMKILLFIFFVFLIIYIISKDKVAKYTTKTLKVEETPFEVQNWVSEIENSNPNKTYMGKVFADNKTLIYIFVPNIKVNNDYYNYKTVNISSMKKDEIIIKSIYEKSNIPQNILIEMQIITPSVKYIKLNDTNYSISQIFLISSE